MTAARFREIDDTHPEVWSMFCEFAETMIAAGASHYSACAILHRVRWESSLRTGEALKINNDLAAYYARKWQKANPSRATFFRNRQSRADARTAAAAPEHQAGASP
jgi:hypothetical protein